MNELKIESISFGVISIFVHNKDLTQEQKDKLKKILDDNPTIKYYTETDIDIDGDYVYEIHTYDKNTIGDVLKEIAKI